MTRISRRCRCCARSAPRLASMRTEFLAGIEQQPIKDKLRATTQELIDRGGYGSPTMFVGGDDMYFGNDRMPLIREAVLRLKRK